MNRRAFLLGATALTLAPLIAKVELINNIPEIRGDGVHDDAPGINALLRNEPCRILDKCVRILNDNTLYFERGNYMLNSAIQLDGKTRGIHIIGSMFRSGKEFNKEIPVMFHYSNYPNILPKNI